MMKNRAATAAGLHYLEHGSMELKTGDKIWKVYGSPVCLLYSMLCGMSDFPQATPRYLPGSFQYEDQAGAEGEMPIYFVSILRSFLTDYGFSLKRYIDAYREIRRSY
jgi:hypothetical protein